jgi:hypothetical protein
VSEFEEGFSEEAREAAVDQPAREGLPAGFRMRADAHYVDLITSRRSESPRDAARRSSRARGAEWDAEIGLDFPPETRGERSDAPLAHLSEDLATIQGAAALLANDTSPLVRRVSLDLINMHAARAAWGLRAEALLSGTHRLDRRGRRLGALLSQVRDALAPACRLSNIGLHVQASNWEAVVSVDADALEIGVIGAVMATIGVVKSDEWAAIRLNAVEQNGELRTIDIAQEEVTLAEGLGRRFFDATNVDRPGGWAASLGAAAAKAAARVHGGDATLQTAERRGSAIRLSF